MVGNAPTSFQIFHASKKRRNIIIAKNACQALHDAIAIQNFSFD